MGLALACSANWLCAQEQYTDVSVQWPSATKLFPNGEIGRFYPGEVLQISASGTIDRNHEYREDCHTEWLVVKKCHDVSTPMYVNYAAHPLVMAWLITTDGRETTVDARKVPPAGLTVSVPKVEGKFDAVVRIAAYVPNEPVGVDRARSYGAYQLSYRVDEKPRIDLLKDYLKTARTADDLRRPEVLNRRLREAEPLPLATLLVEHATTRWKGNAADVVSERERILKLAQDLAPGNREVSVALSDHYLRSGNFVGAELQVRDRMKNSQNAAASAGATQAQVLAAGSDAEELGTIYEKRAGLVGGRDVAAAEFWYGEAAGYFSRAQAIPRLNTALGKQTQVLMRIRTLSSLEKAVTVLKEVYAKLPSTYESPDSRLSVLGVSRDGRVAHFSGAAEPGLLVGRVDLDELPVRKLVGRATPVGVYNEGVVVASGGATENSYALKFVSLKGGEPGLVPLPSEPKQVAVVRNMSALVVGQQGTKQQLWRVAADTASKVLELELGSGWFSDSDSIQSVHASPQGSFAVVIGRTRSVPPETFEFDQTLEIYGADNTKRSQLQVKRRLSFADTQEAISDGQKLIEVMSASDLGILRSAAISPDGTRAVAFWSAAVPSRSKWMVLNNDSSTRTLQVPTDTVLISAGPADGDAWRPIPLEALPQGDRVSPLLTTLPPGLPPQGWAPASFSRDGQRIVVSNWVNGVLVFDLEGRLLDRIEIPQWSTAMTTASGQKQATVVPFGHIWRNGKEILVGGIGNDQNPFVLSVNIETRKVTPVKLSRTALLQLRNWDWNEEKEGVVPSPLLVPDGADLHIVSVPDKEHVLRSLPSFEVIGQMTTPFGDPLIDKWPVGMKRPTSSGLLADLQTGKLTLGVGAAPSATFSIAVSRSSGITFVDFVPNASGHTAILRDQDSGKLLASFAVELPKDGFRFHEWGDCLAFVDSAEGWVPQKPLRQLTWVRVGNSPAAGAVQWKDTPGTIESMRCSANSKPAVLLMDSRTGAIGWQGGILNGIQPPFEPVSGWTPAENTYISKRSAGNADRLLVRKFSEENEAFIFGTDASGIYKVLEGPLEDDSLVTDESLTVVGVYKKGRVELRKVGSSVVLASVPVDAKPDAVLESSLLVTRWIGFSLWPFSPDLIKH